MADANTFIGINAGASGMKGTDFTIQGTAPSTDFYFYMAALDANSHKITRLKAILALQAIQRVLESQGTFTTEMNN